MPSCPLWELPGPLTGEAAHELAQRPEPLLQPHPPVSSSVLQAMDLGVPVLARHIPGNAAVVTHEVTGLLFSDPQVRRG